MAFRKKRKASSRRPCGCFAFSLFFDLTERALRLHLPDIFRRIFRIRYTFRNQYEKYYLLRVQRQNCTAFHIVCMQCSLRCTLFSRQARGRGLRSGQHTPTYQAPFQSGASDMRQRICRTHGISSGLRPQRRFQWK